jgi:hypothetical protein
MAEPIRAEDVLVECWMEVGEIGKEEVRALLAHGSEYGVAILADGSLRPLTEGEASDA